MAGSLFPYLHDFVDEAGDDVTVLDVEVVVGTEHVAGNHWGWL